MDPAESIDRGSGMEFCYILLAMIAGACAPLQAGINSQLRLWTADPIVAATISFAVGTLGLLAYVMVLRIPWPPFSTAGSLPWWQWTGGFLGAFLVVITIILAPRMGAATMIGFFIAGQMLASLVMDHFGLVGYDMRPASLLRMIGAALLIIGVVLIRKY
jgi:transporter family-2 protein